MIAEAAERLDAVGVDWLLAGGAARALLSPALRASTVRDVDLEVAGADFERARAILGAGVAATDTGDDRVTSLRALVRSGARVRLDLSADVTILGPSPLPPDFALQRGWSVGVALAGRRLPIAPPEELVVRAAAAGDHARLARLGAQAMARGLRSTYVLLRLARARAAS